MNRTRLIHPIYSSHLYTYFLNTPSPVIQKSIYYNLLECNKEFKMATNSGMQKTSLCLIVCILFTFCLGLDLTDTCGDKISGCYCTDIFIDCNGADIQDTRDIYPFITNQTYHIHMTNGNIKSIPRNAFTDSSLPGPLIAVRYLNLSGNGIETVNKESFQQLPNLEILDLSNNDVFIDSCDLQSQQAQFLRPLKEMKNLLLHNFINTQMNGSCGPGLMFSSVNMKHLTSLDVSSNGYDVIDDGMSNFLRQTGTIESLNFSSNLLTLFDPPQCMTNLKVLDLSNNRISYVGHDVIDFIDSQNNTESVRLGGNTFDCTCQLTEFTDWLNTTDKPLDFDNMKCVSSDNASVIGRPLRGIEFYDICQPTICIFPGPPVTVHKASLVAISLAVAVTLASVIVTVIICCRRRRRGQQNELKQQLKNRCMVHPTLKTAKAGTDSESNLTADVSKSLPYSRMV